MGKKGTFPERKGRTENQLVHFLLRPDLFQNHVDKNHNPLPVQTVKDSQKYLRQQHHFLVLPFLSVLNVPHVRIPLLEQNQLIFAVTSASSFQAAYLESM